MASRFGRRPATSARSSLCCCSRRARWVSIERLADELYGDDTSGERRDAGPPSGVRAAQAARRGTPGATRRALADPDPAALIQLAPHWLDLQRFAA